MNRLVICILLTTLSSLSYGKICTNQLQEEANVFEVNCLVDISMCMVTGYFTHPMLSAGYSGVVAVLKPTHEKVKQNGSKLIINTFRHGTPKVETPIGYFYALASAEKMLLGEQSMNLIYYDARTGNLVPRPVIKCE